MGTLLTFQPSLHGTKSAGATEEMGKLLLFTGVRYERSVPVADQPAEKSRGGRARSRRRP